MKRGTLTTKILERTIVTEYEATTARCGRCGREQVFEGPADFHEAAARSAGWKDSGRFGWICPPCAFEREADGEIDLLPTA